MTEFCLTLRALGIYCARLHFLGNAVCPSRVTARRLRLADQLGEASLVVDQRQVAQVVAAMLSQKANSTASLPRRWFRNG